MEKWRLLKLGEVDAYTSNPMLEMLGIAKSRGTIGNTLALYSPSSYARLGKSTSFSQINASFCKEKGLPIFRDIFGGGAYLNGDMCSFILLVDREFFPTRAVAADLFIKCVVKAYQILGVTAKHRPKSNDVLVGERKITGTGIHHLGDAMLLVGTILLDFNYDLVKALIIPAEKFKDKPARSVKEWVTTAKKELNRDVSYEEAEAAVIQGFKDTLQVEFEASNCLTEAEGKILEGLQVKYRSEEWIKYGKWSPVKDYWRPE